MDTTKEVHRHSTRRLARPNGRRGPKFQLGRIYATSQAQAALHILDVVVALGRHHRGDWGDVCAEDWQENEVGLRDGFRPLSVYRASQGTRFWIIAEWDRSVTTILLPEDY